MNLFVDDLGNYLIEEWTKIQSSKVGSREARFVVESLSPENTIYLLGKLEEYRLLASQNATIECHFKVARGLWEAWGGESQEFREDFTRKVQALGGVEDNGSLRWIDEEDKLTWYRNLTKPDDKDAIVVILIGLNHTSDQGGLNDFHLVDESRLWNKMGQCYTSWVTKLAGQAGLDEPLEADVTRFDEALQKLFAIKPRRLLRLAEFFESELLLNCQSPDSLNEILICFYQHLPFWEIPPVNLSIEQVSKVRETGSIIKDGDTLISHQKLNNTSEQKKAWAKVEAMLADTDFELPDSFDPDDSYESVEDYSNTLRRFIFEADSSSKERLLNTDMRVLIKQLKLRDSSPKVRRESNKPLSGSSTEAFLLSIWETIHQFAIDSKNDSEPWTNCVSTIKIVAEQFNHDLDTDNDKGVSGNELAKDLLHGCLGGLSELLQGIDLSLPMDEEQAMLPSSEWERKVKIICNFEPESYRTSRKRPHLRFTVHISNENVEDREEYSIGYKWAFESTHAERVRYQCAGAILAEWHEPFMLPAFRLGAEEMTALYFAADEEEANRLMNNSLGMIGVIDLMEGVDRNKPKSLDPELNEQVRELSQVYRSWLSSYVEDGYFTATTNKYPQLEQAYERLAKGVLDCKKQGSLELLRRFYKAFLLINSEVHPNDQFIRSAVATGVSPAVLELTSAREFFLRDYFNEIIEKFVKEDDIKAPKATQALTRLLNLVTIQRPLAGLVVDHIPKLSAKVKSFNLLHYLGEQPSGERSLAVQTLLREDDESNSGFSEIKHTSEDSKIITKVLKDYQNLYPFAADGIRIIAVHVENVPLILSGVDNFLKDYLKNKTGTNQPAFFCELMIYSTSSSPISVEQKITQWRDDMVERFREEKRRLTLSVGHRFAVTREDIHDLLKKEPRLYDVAFLFRFLGEDITGKTETADPFEIDFNDIGKFPISEYPRPIQQGDDLKRQSLLSNRRLRIQTLHGDLSARLRNDNDVGTQHLIFGEINYAPWHNVVEAMHQSAQWVACVDPFIDKRLLGSRAEGNRRKIVGFTSGLGAYGELNLSISTEQDTLTYLTGLVKIHLKSLLPFNTQSMLDDTASRIVEESEEVIGLSSLRAVIGQGEKIREVIGFAAIHRLLAEPAEAVMTQLLPIDAFTHWFNGSDVELRPDLLQLSLTLRDNDIPLIQATIVECKLAKNSERHLEKAIEQVQDGLSHLTQLFCPHHCEIQRVHFDRRYWWAQLQRALISRTIVSLSDNSQRQLNAALEKVTNGDYEIAWKAAVFTFWTDMNGNTCDLNEYKLSTYAVKKPFQLPLGFVLNHWEMGYQGILGLFENNPRKDLEIIGEPISISPMKKSNTFTSSETKEKGKIVPAITSFNQPGNEVPIEPPSKVIIDEAPTTHSSPEGRDNVSEFAPSPVNETAPLGEKKVSKPADKVSIKTDLAHVPEKLLIGTKVANGEPVYWHYGHPGLRNRHMLLFGSSGSGKTYGIQCLLAEMAAQRLQSAIIDYTDGFLPNQVESRFKEVAKPKDYFVKINQLPLRPFRRQKQIIDPDMPPIEDSPFDVASRVTSIFKAVFGMGDQQSATLVRVLEAGITSGDGFSLEDLLGLLRDPDEVSSGETLANKLEPFVKAKPFSDGDGEAWEEMMNSMDSWVNILQLKGYSRDIYRIITEFALWDLYDYATLNGSKNRPIPIVLDEIQNLNHSSDSPIDKMLREGRKFGLSLMLATQTISNFDQEQKDRLFMADQKLFFRPADTEIKSFAKILSSSTSGVSESEWISRLSKLKKGECYSLGPVMTSSGELKSSAVLVSVTAFENRDFGSQI